MDTIKSAIWGDNNARAADEEPISGEQGRGTVSEPYDKGNEEIQQEEEAKNANAANQNANMEMEEKDGPSDATNQTGDPSSGVQPEQKQQGADRPEETPDNSGNVDSAADNSNSAVNNSSSTADKPSTSDISGDGEKPTSSKSGKPDMPHTDSQREELMKTGEFPRDPDDHSGEPMKMHGGSADKDKPAADDGNDAESKVKTDRSASVAQEGGGPHGKTLGTGTEYFKSSGVAADGGDFDATKPGAGAEATRLMEEAGLKTEGQQAPSQQDAPAKDANPVEKPGKISKLKEKLHIGKAN